MAIQSKNILVVINTIAGNGLANKIYSQFFRFLKHNDILFFPYHTTGINDKENIQKLLVHREFDTISILGGDGTINAVINAIGKKDYKIHVLPCGTGNDLLSKISPSKNVSEHFDTILKDNTVKIDLFNCNNKRFIVSFGIGFDGAVCETVEAYRSKRIPKQLAYWYAIVRIISGWKEVVLEIEDSKRDVFLLSLANNDRFGGGFLIAPKAELDDQLLELVIVKKIGFWDRWLNILKLKNGNHLNMPIVDYKRVKQYAIYSEQVIPAHVDGELMYDKNYIIQYDRSIEICV